MTKETHHFIILVMMVVLIVVVFTLCFTHSLFPGKEQVPRRSRAVTGLPEIVSEYH